MSRATTVHHNPNFLIAIAIIVLSVAAAILISPSVKTTKTSQEDKVVKTLAIKELGINVGLNSTLQNLKYEADNTPLGPGAPAREKVSLTLKEYTDLSNKCTGLSGVNSVLKKLIKIDGQAGKQTGSKVLKQLKTYYILSLDSGLPTSDQCKKSKLRPQLETLYKKLNSQLDSSIKSSSAI